MGGGWVGGWTETKLMLSQLKLKLNLKLELSLAKLLESLQNVFIKKKCHMNDEWSLLLA